jgi:predicted nucleic-acid-binding Zn-ribbon protein
MNQGMTCAKCGSTKIIPHARVIDRGDYSTDVGNVRLAVARNPQALVFKGLERVDSYARVCGECGFAELFVEDADSLYEAYVQSRQDRE